LQELLAVSPAGQRKDGQSWGAEHGEASGTLEMTLPFTFLYVMCCSHYRCRQKDSRVWVQQDSSFRDAEHLVMMLFADAAWC
jgi:hypothetical protein